MTLFIIMISLVAIAWIAVFYIGFCRKHEPPLEKAEIVFLCTIHDNPPISFGQVGVFSEEMCPKCIKDKEANSNSEN